jgi:D-ribose pyranose/furanose isomerase RbsD
MKHGLKVGRKTINQPHVEFNKRVSQATGPIRTGDAVQCANTILVSA